MISEIDLQSLWKELDDYERELDIEADSLQDVWVKIAVLKTKSEKEANELLAQNEFKFLEPDQNILFNVGGQIFESNVEILTRDPYSVLAACCRVQSPFPKNKDGFFYIDRDWWLFRHIMAFLRSHVLPNELETLKELYQEATFFRLETLQRAIEEIPLDQISNFSPQIAVTWPGMIEGAPNPLRRPRDNKTLNDVIFKNI